MPALEWTKTLLAPTRFASGPHQVKCPVSMFAAVSRVLEHPVEPSRRVHFERLRDALAAGREARFEDPASLLRTVCRHASDHAQSRNVPLVVHCACQRVFVKETFAEALFHLLHNAINANRSGHPIVLDVRDDRDGHVWQIHDMGFGMVPTVLARLGDCAVDDADSGLGVAVANAIIQDHDGVLRYESGAGVGTTATVWVPLS